MMSQLLLKEKYWFIYLQVDKYIYNLKAESKKFYYEKITTTFKT